MAVTTATALRVRRQLYILGLAGASGFFVATAWVSNKKAVEASAALPIQQDADVTSVWPREARQFDADVDATEKWFLFGYLRRRLLKHARGRTLEVGVGTGRNLDAKAYLWEWQSRRGFFTRPTAYVDDLTCIDLIPEMLQEAAKKAEAMGNTANGRALRENRIHFLQGDASALPFPQDLEEDQKFDTVIQTMGLCSETQPEKALKEMQRVCKREGKILLLDHGVGTWQWLNNNIIHATAKSHALKYGCWWNRDIGAIVRRSGLIIEKEERWHLGTTTMIIARPGPP